MDAYQSAANGYPFSRVEGGQRVVAPAPRMITDTECDLVAAVIAWDDTVSVCAAVMFHGGEVEQAEAIGAMSAAADRLDAAIAAHREATT